MKKTSKKINNNIPYESVDDFMEEKLKNKEIKFYFDEERAKRLMAESVKKARTKAGLTQRELAKKIKSTQAVIGRIESCSGSNSPSLGLLFRIVTACNGRLQISMSFDK